METRNIKDIKTAPWDSMGNDLTNSRQNKPYLNLLVALGRHYETDASFRSACQEAGVDKSLVFNLVSNPAVMKTLAERSAVFAEALATVDRLVTKDRYTTRVRSALAWALSDFDTVTVAMDLRTMPTEDLEQFKKEVAFRLLQLQLLDKFLVTER